MDFIKIGLVGYAASLTGFLAAFIFLLNANRFSLRFQGILGGFTGGILIAFVCFGLLPEAFAEDGLFYGVMGILAGACSAMAIESRVTPHKGCKAGIVTAVGVALHNIPEGIALGSALDKNMIIGLSMALVIALHCLPEALAVVVPLQQSGTALTKLLALCFLLALPMAVSSLIGAALSNVSQAFVSVCSSFAGGVIIYITCGDIIPDSKKTWNGRLTAFGAVFGFAAGVLLTAVL